MRVLITGGCGFLGTNLSKSFIDGNNEVVIIDSFYREGSKENLNWLLSDENSKNINVFSFDISNNESLRGVFIEKGPFDYVCHVAGQVAMTTSLKNPRIDMMTNIIGTFNLLEAVREFSPNAFFAYSSTNKVYGDLADLEYEEHDTRMSLKKYPKGITETLPLDFSTPYGCSKGSADQYVRDWARIYGLKTVVFRHSSIYGGRQYSTAEQGWIGWFCKMALEQKKAFLINEKPKLFSISGSGKQVRDVLNASDLVNLYKLAYEKRNTISGEIFNIGGGVENSLSILELLKLLENYLDIPSLKFEKISRRKSDQDVFIADITKAKNLIGWVPKVNAENGIKEMLLWCEKI
tara:strand:+ start:110 stop:1156 length:1047 start_codon:yes stop_codon:yes gene_type:complete